VTRVSAWRTERVNRTGSSVTPARNDPPAPAMNSTEHSAGSQFSPMRSTTLNDRLGHGRGTRHQARIEHVPRGMLAGGADHQQAQAGARGLGIDLLDDVERSETSVPPQPVPGLATWK